MAYHDEKGRITIDEQAANRDINRLRQSAEILKESREAIRSLQRQSGDMQGNAAQAILEKSREMEKSLTEMIAQLEDLADFIRRTVQHYQRLDEELKKTIQQAASAASGAAAHAGKVQSAGGAAGAAAGQGIGGAAGIGASPSGGSIASQLGSGIFDALSSITKK